MANLKASIKDIRKSARRATSNKKVKDRTKLAVKSFKTLLSNDKVEEAKKAYIKVSKMLDKSVGKKIVKKNTASRKKSRLAKQLNKITAANVKTAHTNS